MRRLQKSYIRSKESGIVSKHRGKVSNNRLSEAIKQEVLSIISSNYKDFGPTLAHEKLIDNNPIKISVESVRKLMITAGLWKGRNRKVKKAIHQMRTRRPCFGELVQIDGSDHDWFEGRADRCCLIVFIDDATSKLLALHFVPTECRDGYFAAIEHHISKYGRPVAYYSDKHGIFRVNHKEAIYGNGETQFGRACRELGVKTMCASTPQAKGRVERANKTLQDRLVKELRLQGISDIETANAFLPKFIEFYNKRFAVAPASKEDAHQKYLPSKEQLELILSTQVERQISKQLEVSFENKIYQIQTNSPGYNMRISKLTVCKTKDKVVLIYKGKILEYKIFDKKNRPTKIVDSKSLNKLMDSRKKAHKPKANHPWRNYPTKLTA
jgi:hypothetical protein